MSPRKSKKRLQSKSFRVQLDPGALLQVKVVEPEKKPPPPSWWQTWQGLVAVPAIIILSLVTLFLWGGYIFRREYQLVTVDAPPLSIALNQPAYVSFGDEAELELAVTNREEAPITGSVTLLFTGNVLVFPAPSEPLVLKFDKLASGASLTHRMKFSMEQSWKFFNEEDVRMALQVEADDRSIRLDVQRPIAIAPLPFIKKIVTLLFYFTSAIGAAVAASLLGWFKKNILGSEAK